MSLSRARRPLNGSTISVAMGVAVILAALVNQLSAGTPERPVSVMAAASGAPVKASLDTPKATLRRVSTTTSTTVAPTTTTVRPKTTTTTAKAAQAKATSTTVRRPTTTSTVARATATTVRPTTTTTVRPVTTTTARPTTTTAPAKQGSGSSSGGSGGSGHTQSGKASWYDHTPGTCAHQTLPFGTIVNVTNVDNGRSTTCKVADRGPFVAGRIIDLERGVFSQLAPTSSGVISVRISW